MIFICIFIPQGILSFNMLHQEFEAPDELKSTIKCFWYNSSELGAVETAFEVMPDGYAEIIFHFGTGCNVLKNGVLQQLPSPFMIGLLDQPAVFYARNRFEVIAVRCYPWTVFDLLGLQPSQDGVHVFQHPIASLQESLEIFVAAGNIKEAIALVKRYFLESQSSVATENTLHKAGTALNRANGSIPVKQVAAAAHATVRTLERKFRQSSGYSVKDISSVMRFEQVRNRLWLEPESNLAGLAQEFGYADQSHLSKEFKRYSSSTPAAFARSAKKTKPGADSDFVAIVQD